MPVIPDTKHDYKNDHFICTEIQDARNNCGKIFMQNEYE